MGFDTSSLEVLLETDFAQFKQKRFELLRSQILPEAPGSAPASSTGMAATVPVNGTRRSDQDGRHPISEPHEPRQHHALFHHTPHAAAEPAHHPGTHPPSARPSLFSHFASSRNRGAETKTSAVPLGSPPPAAMLHQPQAPAHAPGTSSPLVAPAPAVHPPPHTTAGQSQPPAASGPSHLSAAAGHTQASDGPSAPEHLHSEMRYPSARRRPQERTVRTFSVAAEHPAGKVGVISLGGEPPRKQRTDGRQVPPPKKSAPAIKRPRPTRPSKKAAPARTDTVTRWLASEDLEGPEKPEAAEDEAALMAVEESELAGEEGAGEEVRVEEESPPGPDGAEAANGHADEDEPDGLPDEEGEEGEGEMVPNEAAGPDEIEQEAPEELRPPGEEEEQASDVEAQEEEGAPPRKVVKKVKAPTKAARPANRGWMAAGLVLMLIVAGAGAWFFLVPQAGRLTARGWHPATAMAGDNVPFDAANSSSSGSPITGYAWDFGDGGKGSLKRMFHDYGKPGNYVVVLTVRDDKGDTASQRSAVTITPLSITVPAIMVGDRANYNVTGGATVSNNVSALYTFPVPVGGTVRVTQIAIDFGGTLNQMASELVQKEDGFKSLHNSLHIDTAETLDLTGHATTNSGSVPINGNIDYDEASYADPASGGVFKLEARARTSLSLAGLTFASFNSSDTLRTYPSVAGVTSQFQLEKIYRGHKFDQADDSTLHGNLTANGIPYYWSTTLVDNAGGLPSIGIHVTADPAAMLKNGVTEFYVDMFVSGTASMPTRTHLHVAGLSGDTSYLSDHSTELYRFDQGTVAVDRPPQSFDPGPLPISMFFSPFENVPVVGAGATSLKLTPAEAVTEAAVLDPTFAQFLAATPQAYAVKGKYSETALPETASWNLTFAYPGAPRSYNVNVTREVLLQRYRMDWSGWVDTPKVTTAENDLTRMLTLASAQTIFQNDSETAGDLFSGGGIQFPAGATLSLEADSTYPAINLASMFASAESSRYAAILQKGAYTSALSMDTGQMMYFWTHTLA